MKRIVILDYGIGNVKSIYNALVQINAQPVLTDKVDEIRNADGVILPGVGAFAKGMENLNVHQIKEPIYDYVRSGKPFLGICLGMQMLLEESEEFGVTPGLGLIKGKVLRLKVTNARLPHVGWSNVDKPAAISWHHSIFEDIDSGSNLYFVHSFAAYPENPQNAIGLTTYGGNTYCSAVARENVFGVQFHPEKSANIGLKILQNFINF